MVELLDASWPGLLLVIVAFGFAPGFCLRIIVLAYPRSDVRRSELIAELYAVPRIQRPLWVSEQLEVALFEGLPQRLAAILRWSARRSGIRKRWGSGRALTWRGRLSYGLVNGVGSGSAVGLGVGFTLGPTSGLVGAFVLGLASGLTAGLGRRLAFVSTAGLAAGLGIGLAAAEGGLTVGLVVGIGAGLVAWLFFWLIWPTQLVAWRVKPLRQ